MSKPRRSWKEKLQDDKNLPRVVTLEGKLSKRWGGGTCVIPAPREVDEKDSNNIMGECRSKYG